MPVTRPVEKPMITAGLINGLLDAINDPHDKCLMAICALRTSEAFGLKWKAYQGDRIVIDTTAYEGRLYARVKTDASRSAVPVPEDIRPFIEAWKTRCPDTSPEALMFPTFGRASARERGFLATPRTSSNGAFTLSRTN